MAKKQLELKQTGILDNKIYETFRYPDFYHARDQSLSKFPELQDAIC